MVGHDLLHRTPQSWMVATHRLLRRIQIRPSSSVMVPSGFRSPGVRNGAREFMGPFVVFLNKSVRVVVIVLAEAQENAAGNQHRHDSSWIGRQQSEMKMGRQYARCYRTKEYGRGRIPDQEPCRDGHTQEKLERGEQSGAERELRYTGEGPTQQGDCKKGSGNYDGPTPVPSELAKSHCSSSKCQSRTPHVYSSVQGCDKHFSARLRRQ